MRENNNNFPFSGRVRDFVDGEFYGFCSDFEQKKGEIQEELRNAIGSKEYVIATYCGDTEEYSEAKSNLEERKMNWIIKLN